MKKIVLASNNKGKIKEFRELFPNEYEIVTMGEIGFDKEIEETGKTFFENALIKAKTISNFCGLDAIADDSGLMVECLGGAPGIYSARYAGEHANDAKNNALLLKNMNGQTNRKARFHSSIVLFRRDGTVIEGKGETYGRILLKAEGVNGFGYDPLFFSDDLGKSFGEATADEKNSVSHRKRALIDLLNRI